MSVSLRIFRMSKKYDADAKMNPNIVFLSTLFLNCKIQRMMLSQVKTCIFFGIFILLD